MKHVAQGVYVDTVLELQRAQCCLQATGSSIVLPTSTTDLLNEVHQSPGGILERLADDVLLIRAQLRSTEGRWHRERMLMVSIGKLLRKQTISITEDAQSWDSNVYGPGTQSP